MVYANNARVSPLAPPALEAMTSALERRASLKWLREDDARAIRTARRALSELIGGDAEEVALVQSATWAANAIVAGLPWRAGDNVVVTDVEYRSVLHALFRLRVERSVEIRVARSDGWGVDARRVTDLVDARTRLVVVPHLPSFCGVVQPVEEIGRALDGSGTLFAVNATQSVGQLPVDVGRMACDLLFATSRKWLRGPRGLGFLFVRREVLPRLRPLVLGHPGAVWTRADTVEVTEGVDRLHAGDYPYPAVLGLAAAAELALEVGPDAIAETNRRLGRLARERLARIPGVRLYDLPRGTTGTVPLTVGGLVAGEVVAGLRARGVIACSLDASVSRWAFEQTGLDELVRISLHHMNREDEVETMAGALERLPPARRRPLD